jgi:Cu2+-exporting ATPase
VRQDARAVIEDLARAGARVHLVSGDRPEITHHVARELGIANVLAGARPRDKLDYVRKLQDGGAVVAMVGDGVNDAAGLAAAQVSIASGEATDIACGRSDIVLPPRGFAALSTAAQTARAALRVIHQNLAWALAYNMIAIPLAACGHVTPLIAGAGMAASSMLVVANSLRLGRPPAAARA